MITSSLARKSLPAIFFFLVFVISSCSSQPSYSGAAGDFRFYVLQVQKADKLTSFDRKPLTPDAGFIFLVVDLAVENKSSQVASGGFDASSVNGRTSSGDYMYSEYLRASNRVTGFGPIPPGGRFKTTMFFQVAATTSDYRITIKLQGGLFGGPSMTIALPPIGQLHPVSFPYDSNRPAYLLKAGQGMSWFGNTSVAMERLDRTPGYLNVQLKINNTTGYVMSQESPRIYWSAAVIGSDGSLQEVGELNHVQASFSLPPGQVGSVVYSIKVTTPDSLKDAVLTMQGTVYGGETKWMAFDLSNVQ